MTKVVQERFEEVIAVRCKMMQERLDAVDRIIELEYALVQRFSKEWPNQATNAGRSAMRVLVAASTYRLLLELWREHLESLLEPENLRWTTAPPPPGWPEEQIDQ